jgi:hypothetical protein
MVTTREQQRDGGGAGAGAAPGAGPAGRARGRPRTRTRGAALLAAAAVATVLALGVAPPAEAAVWGPRWGAIGGGRNLGIGGFVGTATGFSLKWFAGVGLSLGINASVQRWWYTPAPTWRAEIDLVWHASVAHGHHAWEMILGPGVGGGVGWWRSPYYYDFCNRGPGPDCWGPFARGIFNWSMLFHHAHFDIFVEPSLVTVFIPGFILDWDVWVGAHYYF